MNYQVALTLKSRNVKTGPIPVSTTTYETCPDACIFKDGPCYANFGPLLMFWQKVTNHQEGTGWYDFLTKVTNLKIGTFWRHNQAGDLPSKDRVHIDETALDELVQANDGKRGFTYTHYNVVNLANNQRIVRNANRDGFTINLSANNLKHADQLIDTQCGPVVVVLPMTVSGPEQITTPNGNKVVVCPATYRDDVTCKSCQLCQRQRDVIVGFPAHGTSKLKASAMAQAA